MAAPIWKDYFVNLGTADGILFRIRIESYSGTIIYTGKSYLRPGETNNRIRLNDICADYLTHALPTAPWSGLNFPTFYVQASTDGTTWTNKGYVQFTKDWSYDTSFNPATMPFSQPINGRVDARMLIPYSALDVSSISAVLTFKDGSTMTVIVPVATTADFDESFDESFAKALRAAQSATAVLDISGYTDLVSVRITNKKTYNVVTDCGEWALYYVNAFGGWDALLLEGSVIRTDGISRRTMGVDYDNNDPSARGVLDYLNEVTPRWTLNTGRMNDAQSAAMPNLLNSPDVYLFNIATRKMLPVILQENEQTVKINRYNGAAFYTMTAALAQDRIRR